MRAQNDRMALDDEMDRKALLQQMAPARATPDTMAPDAATAAANRAGMTGPLAAPVAGIAPGEPAPAAARPGVFQSDNKSLSGYMQEAAAAYRPEVIKLGSDAERKAAVEAYIRSLEPEMRARGWTGGEVKNEKFQENGRWKDIYRDVDGAAEAQYLDVTDSGPAAGGAPMMAGAPSTFQGIQSLMPTDTDFYNTLQQKLQEILGGPGAMDRKALLSQLQR